MSDENVERCAGVLLSAIRDLMSESRGVVGLHKNGDVAPWDEIDVEGRYSEWLGDAMGALHDALAHARASRPREAGKVRIVCEVCDGKGTIAIVDHYDDKGESVYAPDECPECEGRLYVERTAYVDGPVAPEACPVSDISIPCPPDVGMGCHATPASATAEGGGEAKAANTNAVARAVGGLLDAWDLSDEDSVVEKVRPHMKAIHRLIERDEFYATPASAAGREGAREKFTKAALLWAEASKHDIACGAPFSSQERRDARMNTVARHMDALHAYDALLAAEAEGGGES